MIKADYNQGKNLVTIEFEGVVDMAQAEKFYPEIRKIVPHHGKEFTLLTDFTLLKKMDSKVLDLIKENMDFFNRAGVTKILRVIPDPEQDIGFNILSLFHYSKKVILMTLPSREEAEKHLASNKDYKIDY